MKRGFDEVYHRMDGMDARFESLENEMNGRFEQVDARFEQIERRISSIEQTLKDHGVILDVHTEQLRDIKRH